MGSKQQHKKKKEREKLISFIQQRCINLSEVTVNYFTLLWKKSLFFKCCSFEHQKTLEKYSYLSLHKTIFSFAITGMNWNLKYIKTENSYFK